MKTAILSLLMFAAANLSAGERSPKWMTFSEVDTLVTRLRQQTFPASEDALVALVPRADPFDELDFVVHNGAEERTIAIFLSDPKNPAGYFVFRFSRTTEIEYSSAVLEFHRWLGSRDPKTLSRDSYRLELVFPSKRPIQQPQQQRP